MKTVLEKYAELLVHYCMEIKAGERLLINTTLLAEPLVREVFRTATRAGAIVETTFSFREQNRIFYQEADGDQLDYVSPLYKEAMESFDAYLFIRAPYNLREDADIDGTKTRRHSEAIKPWRKIYSERTATRNLRRNLCQFPTLASAQEAGMSLEAYEHFVYDSCRLFDDNPIESWLQVRADQQKIVDHLNNSRHIHYKNGQGMDIQFSVEGRTWINSDGQTNMPSGEVYTTPVEDSVQGVAHFDFPAIYGGHEVQGVTLWVKDGYIERWEAKQGQHVLDNVFQIEGTRRFGEAAIGTNYRISRFTKNILFDEKIGGSVHMAVGQAYLQTGGKNESSVHWDMISNMKIDGEIYTDGTLIYKNGEFLLD